MSFWDSVFGRREPTPEESLAIVMRFVQERRGLPVTGEADDATKAAVIAFKRSVGFVADPWIGPLTLAELRRQMPPPPAVAPASPPSVPKSSGEPRWLTEARKESGQKEVSGSRHNPRITKFWQDVGASWFTDDETPWCGGFVGAMIRRAGIKPLSAAETPRARAWEYWGRSLSGPALGAVVTFWRGSPSSGSGHVGFVVGKDHAGRLMVLGGNQSDAVTIAPFDTGRVTSYRWPSEEPTPLVGFSHLPVLNANGAPSSTNEA